MKNKIKSIVLGCLMITTSANIFGANNNNLKKEEEGIFWSIVSILNGEEEDYYGPIDLASDLGVALIALLDAMANQE